MGTCWRVGVPLHRPTGRPGLGTGIAAGCGDGCIDSSGRVAFTPGRGRCVVLRPSVPRAQRSRRRVQRRPATLHTSRGTPRFHPLPASEGDRGANPLPCPPSPLRTAADVSSASQGGRLHGRHHAGIAGVVDLGGRHHAGIASLGRSRGRRFAGIAGAHRTGRSRSRGWHPLSGTEAAPPCRLAPRRRPPPT